MLIGGINKAGVKMNLKISKMRREAGIFAAAAPGGRAQLSMVHGEFS